MNVSKHCRLSLAAFALVAALGWSFPGAAQELGPALADLPTGGSCTADLLLSPDEDARIPAQSCGPCILDFCPIAGIRCTFSHCGTNPECCVYECLCDPTCAGGGAPSGACYRIPIFCCGNGEQEPGEQCDGGDLNGQTCASLGYFGGTLACWGNCTFNTAECTNCGNGIQEDQEDCDGTDLDGMTCASLGFTGGTLACDGECNFDTSGCFYCGDGFCEGGGEDCDVCPADCEGKSTGPPSGRFCCGNGIAEPAEGDGTICDGNY